MKFLVVGSHRKKGANQAKFRKACEQLGLAIADSGNSLILCTMRPNAADKYALKGYLNSARKNEVHIHRVNSEANNIPYDNIIKTTNNTSWLEAHTLALHDCDVIISLSGEKSTRSLLYSAKHTEKPFVLIPSFGGESEIQWGVLKENYTKKEREGLEMNWNNTDIEWGGRIVSSAIKIAKRNPFRMIKTNEIYASIAMAFISISVWSFLLTKPIYLPYFSIILIMLTCCSICGTILRYAFNRLGFVKSDMHGRHLLIGGIASVLLSFCFLLMSQATSYSLNGKGLTFSNIEDFRRISFTLSIPCFLSAFFVENAFNYIKDKFNFYY